MMTRPSLFLRRVLTADAIASAATGLAMAFGASLLAAPLGLPEDLLRYAGVGLLPFAGLVFWVSRRDTLPRAVVWAIIGANALWVAESVLLLVGGWVTPNGLGTAFVLTQAAAVAVFAELEVIGLRRTGTVATAG